jgi:hypothetical protein
MALKPVEAEGWAAGELARRAKRDQALEQPPAGAVAQAGKRRRGGDGVVGEQRRDSGRLPLGAQFWRGVGEPGRSARQVLRKIEGGERRAGISECDQPLPAWLARARPPSLARAAAGEQLAREERQRRRLAEGFGQRCVGAKKRERLGVCVQRRNRRCGRGRDDRGGATARNRLPQRDGEVRRVSRIERRLHVGRDRARRLGRKRSPGPLSVRNAE